MPTLDHPASPACAGGAGDSDLDLRAAQALGLQAIPGQPPGYFYWDYIRDHQSGWFNPSENWQRGGPIIQRECIELFCISRNGDFMGEWHARCQPPRIAIGPTPLIAAMRAFVASKGL